MIKYIIYTTGLQIGLQIIKAEDKWKSKYPNIAAKIDELEKKLEKLQKGD